MSTPCSHQVTQLSYSPRGQLPTAQQSQSSQKRKAHKTRKPPPKPKPKQWTKVEVDALYPIFAVGTRVQLHFEFGTAGPSTWIWEAGEVTDRYRVANDHQALLGRVKWDPPFPTNKKEEGTLQVWHNHRRREVVPMQMCTPDTQQLTGTAQTGEFHNASPIPKPKKQNCKTSAAQGIIKLLDA